MELIIYNPKSEFEELLKLWLDNLTVISNKATITKKVNNKKFNEYINIINGLLSIDNVFDFSEIKNVNVHEVLKATKVIIYYFLMFYYFMDKEHPFIKREKIDSIIEFILTEEIEDVYKKDFYKLEVSEYYELINKHFQTKYKNCDYNIFHFFTNGIILNRGYEIGYW